MDKDIFLKFLSAFELSYSKISKILDVLKGNFSFDSFSLSDEVEKILGDDFSSIIKKANPDFLQKYLNRLDEKGIKNLTCEDSNYPKKLFRCDDPPYYLFYKGDINILNNVSVSIVGTRSPSNYGVVVTERFAGELAQAGAVIISGLAYGVDSIAHRKTLLEKGKTVAVLAGGFDHIYPPEHFSLFNEISQKGLVLSEHRPDIKALKFNFPQRNRIVAALSDALLVTEAGAKSGTSITKDFALDYGIPIYAIPGNITSPKSDGTNRIIASMQGTCTLEPINIINDLGLKKKKNIAKQLSINESLIVQQLQDEPKNVDMLVEILNLPIANLNSLLTSLEIKGIIKRMPGGFFALG